MTTSLNLLQQAAVWPAPPVEAKAEPAQTNISPCLSLPLTVSSYPQRRQILGGRDDVSTEVKLVDLPENYDVYIIHIIVPNLEREGYTEHSVEALPILESGCVCARHMQWAAGSALPTDAEQSPGCPCPHPMWRPGGSLLFQTT